MFSKVFKCLFHKVPWFVMGLALSFPLSAEKGLNDRIDDHVRAKAGNVPFSEAADDASFLRRVTLDLTGNIPTASEVTAFLDDESPGKRTKLIDRLIAGDLFAAHWMERLSVMLLKRLDQGKVPKEEWGEYLKETLRNKPLWDVMVVALGFGTALLGKKAAMLCTASVEEVIEDHYQSQLKKIGDDEKDLKGSK